MVRHTNLTVLRERLVSAGGAPYEYDRITGEAGLCRWCTIRTVLRERLVSTGGAPYEFGRIMGEAGLCRWCAIRIWPYYGRGWSLQVVHHTNLTVLRERLVSQVVRHTNLTVLRERLVSAGGAPYEFDRITGEAGLCRWCAIRIWPYYGRGWSLQVVRHTNLAVLRERLVSAGGAPYEFGRITGEAGLCRWCAIRIWPYYGRGWSLQVVRHTNLAVLRERLVSAGGAPYEFDRITGEAGLCRWCAIRI